MKNDIIKTVAIVVAHPDDETLWAGGTILSHPEWKCVVVCLCRKNDPDRAPRFKQALKMLCADGIMGDLDDGTEQHPVDQKELEDLILKLLPIAHYDLIITHDSSGEYTRHRRHEEVNKAITHLWHLGRINTKQLWTFAYEDGNRKYFPKAIEYAPIYTTLSEAIWDKKRSIITDIYGFEEHSWETETTPLAEAFWQFKDSHRAIKLHTMSENEITMSRLSIFKLLTNKTL